MKQRVSAVCLLVLLLLSCLLSACGGTDVTTQQTTTTTKVTTTAKPKPTELPQNATLAQALSFYDYKLVYPEGTAKTIGTSVSRVEAALIELTDDTFTVKDDYVNQKKGQTIPKNNKEILFGVTNRIASQNANEQLQANRVNSSRDWQIIMKDQEIVICAQDPAGVSAAADAFISMLYRPLSQYPLEGYDSGIQRHTWELETLGGVSLNDYRIVIPHNASQTLQTQAKALQSAVYAKSGFQPQIITDESAPTAHEFVLGHTTRDVSVALETQVNALRNNNHQDYIISGSGTTVALMAGDDDLGSAGAVSAFSTMLTAAQKDTLQMSKTYLKEGLQDFVIDNVPAGQFQIVYAKNADLDIKYGALQLQKYFRDKTGYSLAIVTDDTAATAHEIVLGKTDRDVSTAVGLTEYHIAYRGGHLVIDAGHYYGVTQALSAFMAAYGNPTAAIVLPDTYRLAGETDIALTWVDDGSAVALDKVNRIPQVEGTYTLVWNDEFNDIWNLGTFNANKWDNNTYMNPGDVKYYTDKSVLDVRDGQLVMITDVMSPTSRKNPVNGARYKTSSMTTATTMNFKYGYLEMRAQPPFLGTGEWPSFWATSGSCALGNKTTSAPYSVEIDYFELFSSETEVVPNLHKWGGTHEQLSGKDQGASTSKTRTYNFSSKKEANKMHTYGFLWTEHVMSFSVDGEFYYTYGLSDQHDFGKEKSGMAGFRDLPLDIILNNQIFSEGYAAAKEGNWAKQLAKKLTDDMFPYYYYVDYMRLYQIDGYGNLWLPKTVKV